MDHDTVSAMAPTVIARLVIVFKSTNVEVGRLIRRPKVVAAVSKWTPAHKAVRPVKRRPMAGRLAMSGASGQKSEASRPMIGLPKHKEPKNAAASASVVRTGCKAAKRARGHETCATIRRSVFGMP
jgi:hypothetical protein